MRSFLVLLLIFVFTKTSAQELKFTFFMKDNEIRVSSPEEADFIRIVKVTDTNLKKYEFGEYYKNDTIKRHGFTSSYAHFLVLEGVVKEYNKSGIKTSEKTYEKNQLVGETRFFYLNGQLKKVIEYIKKEKTKKKTEDLMPAFKVLAVYDSLGVQTVSNGNGFAEEKEHAYIHKGKYKNGYKDSVWIGSNPEEDFSYEEMYAEGKFLSGTSLKFGKRIEYSEVEVRPDFKGGLEKFYRFVGQEFNFPGAAKNSGVSGRVILSFNIETDGNITDIVILNDPGLGTADEAVRVLKMSPKWIPGTLRGIPVRVSFTLPIMLNLEVAR